MDEETVAEMIAIIVGITLLVVLIELWAKVGDGVRG
jgi:hypothetical protein